MIMEICHNNLGMSMLNIIMNGVCQHRRYYLDIPIIYVANVHHILNAINIIMHYVD